MQRGFQRTDKQCRERWQHHLDPSLRYKRTPSIHGNVALPTYCR